MNYRQLAQDDPGGTVQAAFDTLSAMTVSHTASEKLITERAVLFALGGTDGETLLQVLEAAGQGNPVIARVVTWLKPGEGKGVDVCNAETQLVLGSLVGQGGVTQEMVDKLIALATTETLKYPNLDIEDIEYVRNN